MFSLVRWMQRQSPSAVRSMQEVGVAVEAVIILHQIHMLGPSHSSPLSTSQCVAGRFRRAGRSTLQTRGRDGWIEMESMRAYIHTCIYNIAGHAQSLTCDRQAFITFVTKMNLLILPAIHADLFTTTPMEESFTVKRCPTTTVAART